MVTSSLKCHHIHCFLLREHPGPQELGHHQAVLSPPKQAQGHPLTWSCLWLQTVDTFPTTTFLLHVAADSQEHSVQHLSECDLTEGSVTVNVVCRPDWGTWCRQELDMVLQNI